MRLATSDPRADPEITLGFLTNREDILVIRRQVRLARRLAQEMKTLGYPLSDLRLPEDDTDESIDAYVWDHLRTSYHYSSTCRMAPAQDTTSPGVVDDELRVWGVGKLRVCDASVFPDIVSSLPMAPVVAHCRAVR